MSCLSRDNILTVDDLKREKVSVPEWGGYIFVRTMTGTERDQYESSVLGNNGKMDLKNIRAKLVVLTAVDEDGLRLFNDDDIEVLGAKSAAALDRVFSKAQTLNKISDDDIEELAKN